MRKKYLITLGKILFSLGALGVVLAQVDLARIGAYLRGIPVEYLAGAFGVLAMAQGMSALRMRCYFASADLMMQRVFALKLYLLGMFYNNVLPGGVGGDGYKVYWFKRHRDFSVKTAIRLLLSERLNGLYVLLLLLVIAAGLSSLAVVVQPYVVWVMIMTSVIITSGYVLFAYWVFKNSWALIVEASWYSVGVQVLTTFTAVVLCWGLSVKMVPEYIVLFLIASIVGVIPITLGGVGLRELTFFYGAPLVSVDAEVGIALSLSFFAVYFAVSLLGLPFVGQRLDVRD